jgi:hypothetical protein
MPKTSYRLVDAQAMARAHPETFGAPDMKTLKTLEPGDFAKLCFDNAERMWVRITEAKGSRYEGLLDNDPVVVRLKCGDRIRFEARHIYACMKV